MSTPPPASANLKLVTMANQIATFFATQSHADAVTGVETHIRKFWDPRMRSKIAGHLAAGGDGLTPLAREAVARLAD